MRMAPHVHHLAQKNVAGVHWMQWIDLRVLGAIEVINIVALDSLVEKWEPQGEDKQRDDEKFPAQGSR